MEVNDDDDLEQWNEHSLQSKGKSTSKGTQTQNYKLWDQINPIALKTTKT